MSHRPAWEFFAKALAVAGFLLAAAAAHAQVAPPQWSFHAQYGDVVYFTFATPTRLERYDLAQEKWLASIPLTSAPTALYADADGLYLAYDRTVARRALDGSNEQALFNSAATINGLLGDASFLFVFAPSSGQSNVTSLRKADGQLVSSWSTYYSLSSGYSIERAGRRIYGIDTYTSSFATIELPYTATGTFGSPQEVWSDTGSFYDNARTYPSPNESMVIRHNGMVYNTPGLAFRASLAGAFDDAAFFGADVLIVLRGSQLVAYANTLLEAGTFTLGAPAQAITVRNGQVYAFSANAASPSGAAVAKVAVTSITAAQPGAALDPVALSIVPDDVIAAGDGTYFLLSKRYQSIFRWSAATARYTASFPLLMGPQMIAYSASLNRLYLGYSTGQINQIKLDLGRTVEEPFANLPLSVLGLQTAGNFIFAVDDSGAWVTHYIFDAAGTLKTSRDWNYFSTEYIWSPGQRRMYFFRDDTSPNDLQYETISIDGQITEAGETPYHGDYPIVHPIRVSTDESGILTGSGIIYAASGLTYAGSLANTLSDATARNNRWVTIRASGTATQLQTWTANLLFDQGFTVPGAPKRVFALADGRMLVLTAVGERTVFSLVDLSGTGSVTSSPIIITEPAAVTAYTGRAAALSVTAQGAGLTFQWKKNDAAIAGATASTLTFASATSANAGTYTVVITNALGVVTSATVSLTVQDPPPPPTIQTQPADQVVPVGSSFSLSVVASGTGPFTYQWRKEDTAIPGATGSSFSKSNIATTDAGNYAVAVTNDGGTTVSRTAVISLPVRAASYSARLPLDARGAYINLQLEGSGSRSILLRALGPALQDLGVAGASTDPKLELFDNTGSLVASNDNWGSAANPSAVAAFAQQVGATPLAPGSRDAAIIVTLPAGVTTVRVTPVGTANGLILFELFDGSATVLPRLAYIGARALLPTPADVIVGGIAFSGAGAKSYLVRALGPALADPSGLADPVLTWNRATTVLSSNDNWGASADAAQLPSLASRFGALPLPANSADSALLVGPSVLAGVYTAQVAAVGTGSGWAALEFLDTDAARPAFQPPVLVNVQIGQNVAPGSDATLAVRAAGTPPLTYLWRKNGAQVIGATESAILLRSAQPADAGTYTVTVTNAAGSTASIPALLTVNGGLPPPVTFTATHAALLYDTTATVVNTLIYPADATALGWSVTLPAGWSYAGGVNEGDVRPVVGATGTLEWAWSTVPSGPMTFTYVLNVPSGETAPRTLSARAILRQSGPEQSTAATPNPLLVYCGRSNHSADTDHDGKFSLGELLRVIELYNTRAGTTRTGQYWESVGTEDGFSPLPATPASATPHYHSVDTDHDGKIGLFELTRMIELYNFRSGTTRTGQYHAQSGTEDGFAPGP